MWVVAVGMLWLLVLAGPPQVRGSCPSQCSCSLHILSDGSKARYGSGWGVCVKGGDGSLSACCTGMGGLDVQQFVGPP